MLVIIQFLPLLLLWFLKFIRAKNLSYFHENFQCALR
jgi:hypothetical protein